MVVGGGVIGAELSMALSALGVKVYLVEVMSRILPFLDSEISSVITKYLRRSGVEIYTSSKAKLIQKKNSEVRVAVINEEGRKEIDVSKVLIATGRRYTTGELGLEKVGVELHDDGSIIVNEEMRTSVPTIYAVGDVTGQPFLAHKAYWQAIVASETISEGSTKNVSGPIPMVIYTLPEVGVVGLTEDKARSSNIPVKVVKFPYSALPRDYTVLKRTPEGYGKLVLDKETGRILGATIVGNQASEIIHLLTLAISSKLTSNDLRRVIYAHPTYSELVRELSYLGIDEGLHL